jgi:hypothetical protein
VLSIFEFSEWGITKNRAMLEQIFYPTYYGAQYPIDSTKVAVS